MSHKKKTRDFSILVQFIVDAYHTGDYINPLYKDREQELHRRYRGHYFGSDFIKEIFQMRQQTSLLDPYFVEELHNIASKLVEKEVEAIKAVSELEREMLQVEGELIRMEAEAKIQQAYYKAMEQMDKDLAEMRRKFNERLDALDFSGLDKTVEDFQEKNARTCQSMQSDFRMAVNFPAAERFDACRRHLTKVRTIIKSFVYEP